MSLSCNTVKMKTKLFIITDSTAGALLS